MRIIGLTGGIACGKSVVTEVMAKNPGFAIIDCDELARKVVEPGTSGFVKVVATFGKEVLTDDGKRLDRKKLGSIVFDNASKRKALEDITNPAIAWEIKKLLLVHFFKGTMLVVIDAPTLFETKKLLDICACTVVIACDPELQLQRLMSRDGSTEAEAKKRINAQFPLGMKIKRADHTFWNDADMETCIEQVQTELIPLLEAKYGMTIWQFFSFLGLCSVFMVLVCAILVIYALQVVILAYLHDPVVRV